MAEMPLTVFVYLNLWMLFYSANLYYVPQRDRVVNKSAFFFLLRVIDYFHTVLAVPFLLNVRGFEVCLCVCNVFRFMFVFYLFVYMRICADLCVCSTFWVQVPEVNRREHCILWSWDYRHLRARMWLLGGELDSSRVLTTDSPAPNIVVFILCGEMCEGLKL